MQKLHLRGMLVGVGGTVAEILLAEDNSADVYLIREALREHGVDCSIRLVTDGQDVLRIIEPQGPPAETGVAAAEIADGIQDLRLIILDLNLPRHDGIEILQRLRDNPAFSHIPVVVLTSSDSPHDRLIVTQLGATRYLRKPSNLEQFLGLGALFKELLEQSEAFIKCKEKSNAL